MKVEIFGPRTKEQQHWVTVLKMMGKELETENQPMAVQKNQAVANQEVVAGGQILTDQKDLIIRQPGQNFLKSQLIVNVQDCH